MAPCPTFIYEVSIMSKWLAKHISTKVSFKITIRKRHVFHWHSLTIKMKPVFLFGVLRRRFYNNIFAFFSARYTNKFTEQKCNMFINEFWHINLYMNISNSNWHNSSFDSTKIKFFFISVPYTITELQPL